MSSLGITMGIDPMAGDRDLFDRDLRGFVPPGAFDAHAHLFRAVDAAPAVKESLADEIDDAGFDAYRRSLRDWMGELAPESGLFFGLPRRGLDLAEANRFVREGLRCRPDSRGLMVVAPGDDPGEVEEEVVTHGWCGFKPYHLFADVPDTFEAEIADYLPEWMWEIADRRSLVITLHLVRRRALADASNQAQIRDFCSRSPGAKLILAHAARGFCGWHTVEGIEALRGLDNVYFDTSAICEPPALEAVLRTFGPRRLLFGSDFPVCEFRGRCVSVGDGFLWLDAQTVDWAKSPFAKPARVGVESLLALRQACRTARLTDADVERVFCSNARELLNLGPERLGGVERSGPASVGGPEADATSSFARTT